jgi:hypothetical protein
MKPSGLSRSVDNSSAGTETHAALGRRTRDRITMSAREFVSERDVLKTHGLVRACTAFAMRAGSGASPTTDASITSAKTVDGATGSLRLSGGE